jgi:membrane protein YqaA with SNARE-associated domain
MRLSAPPHVTTIPPTVRSRLAGARQPADGIGSFARALRRIALRPVLDKSWNLMMYCCAAVALVTLAVCDIRPSWSELAIFTWLMFFTSGPTATFLPSASEPVLMAFGILYPATLLATLGVAAIGLVEWVNYRVFTSVMHAPVMTRVRTGRLTQRLESWFRVCPFLTTVVAALTPIPFWVVRICGVTARYPMGRFILATVVGRFPRIWLFAFLGTALPFAGTLALLVAGFVLVAAGVALAAKRRRAPTFAT